MTSDLLLDKAAAVDQLLFDPSATARYSPIHQDPRLAGAALPTDDLVTKCRIYCHSDSIEHFGADHYQPGWIFP